MNEQVPYSETAVLELVEALVKRANKSSLLPAEERLVHQVMARLRVLRAEAELENARRAASSLSGVISEPGDILLSEWIKRREVYKRTDSYVRALQADRGITTLFALITTRPTELNISGFGRKTKRDLEEALAACGLHTGMTPDAARTALIVAQDKSRHGEPGGP